MELHTLQLYGHQVELLRKTCTKTQITPFAKSTLPWDTPVAVSDMFLNPKVQWLDFTTASWCTSARMHDKVRSLCLMRCLCAGYEHCEWLHLEGTSLDAFAAT